MSRLLTIMTCQWADLDMETMCKKAKEMGYEKIITYILQSELGTSLKASGWICEDDNVGGSDWNTPSRPREVEPMQMSLFEEKQKYPVGEKKQRWCKWLQSEVEE